ncbi:MAG: glycoside hydrolase family 2 protein, partial [Fibrobacter sp.]|nr:glycoside hydrolase family 2 protein [Fibrobacter sp.]
MFKQRKDWLIAFFFCCITGTYAGTYIPQKSNRINIPLDTGWLFNKSDNASFSGGTAFNDANWTAVCLPHSNVITKHAYLDTASFRIITWYRRHFTAPVSYNNRRFLLEFQAVATVATVYVNGSMVGTPHKGAYTPFTLDITEKIKFGQDNVIAVKVDSKRHIEIPPEVSSRLNMDFMVFGGIVRPVTMIITDPVYVDWTFVSTQNPSQTAPINPTVQVKTQVINKNSTQRTCTITTSIVDNTNTVVAQASSQAIIPAGGSKIVDQTTSAISNPHLWDIDDPYLYSVYIQIHDEGGCVDEYKTRMGIRSLTLSKIDGQCYLNGKKLKLRGLNRHETYPYIGRAASKRLQRKDADILKYELGCNLVRTSHYPQAPEFLDRCDEIGLLVLEEIPGWQLLDNGTEWRNIQMQTLVDMVIRDRNHPCILSWGCRVNESQDDAWYKSTNETARSLDPTRLTHGVRFSKAIDPAYFWEDIWTRNFILPDDNKPASELILPYITTEFAGHTLQQQAHSWDNDSTLILQITNNSYGHATGLNANYKSVKWAGLVGWCAFDYNSPHANATTAAVGRNLMSYVSPHGVSSIFRLPKLAAYFYQSQRDPQKYGPMVHICNYWTPKSTNRILVVSNCEEVALYQDGVLISKKAPELFTDLPHPCFQWVGVPFKPGELKAIGYINGKEIATHVVRTPGNPVKLTVVPDTNVIYTGGDMTRVVVSMFDQNDQLLHLRGDSVFLSASGAGDFIGEERTALEGGQMAFYVKTRAWQTGAITCQASSAGLSASATIMVTNDSLYTPVYQQNQAVNSRILHKKSRWYTIYGKKIHIPNDVSG